VLPLDVLRPEVCHGSPMAGPAPKIIARNSSEASAPREAEHPAPRPHEGLPTPPGRNSELALLRTEIARAQLTMAARSIWNGTLQVGSVEIPTKLYAAVEDETVHFHLLHDKDHERVKQHMVNPATGEVRESSEVHKGYEVQRGTFVLLSAEELAALEPPASKQIEVQRFVPARAIDPVWYERPYYLGPAGKSPEYFALARVLQDRERVGVARWVMRKRVHYGALRAHGDYLTLSTLHGADSVAAAPKVAPASRAADARELSMAEQLVEALAGEFNPEEFADEHRARVLELIAAKAKGKAIELPPKQRRRAAKPLDAALEQSLKLLQKQAPEQKERQSA
jgi:DNA end-binding protein Ku